MSFHSVDEHRRQSDDAHAGRRLRRASDPPPVSELGKLSGDPDRSRFQVQASRSRSQRCSSTRRFFDDLRSAGLSAADAVVLCDHDTPDRDAILALLLDGEAGYAAMMGSEPRAAATYAELSGRYDDGKLRRLHVPAGLNIGGKGPGEIAVSVLAEIIAHDHDRPGGPMRVGSR